MGDEAVLSRKLAALREYVDALREADDITWETYRSDIRARAFVERYLHLATEVVLDLGNHIISQQGWREPKGYADLFTVLGENGVLPPERVPEFQKMAGFRNLLVHRYEQVDDEIVYGVFRKRLGTYEEFARYVADWARRQGR
ncbi:type VII toxin-antitoxin system HepT family RNase toxin [Deferrisoma palaeochoriense]